MLRSVQLNKQHDKYSVKRQLLKVFASSFMVLLKNASHYAQHLKQVNQCDDKNVRQTATCIYH